MLTRTIRVAAKAIVTGMLGRADVRIDGDRPWDLRVHNDRFFPRALRGSLGFGESYVDGDWDAECLDALIRRLLRRDMSHPLVRLGRKLRTLRARLFNLQTRRRSRVVAEEHYDLDHRMYQFFLGPWYQYSCCFFHKTGDLTEAEVQKLEMICDKLEITSQDRVLDIGCGWGGFAKYAAQTRGCRVVGLSLSAEQVEFARRFTAGLPVEIRHLDYRDLAGASLEPFDKILSCGMIEHVGYKNYRTLMRAAFGALRRDGLLLLHTIGNRATTYSVEPWIEKYIFPNSMVPAMPRLAEAVEGLFVVEDWENYGHYYARTLEAWHERFESNWEAIRRLEGPRRFDERFRRMWKYYLLSSKAAFEVEDLHLWQIVMRKYGSQRGVYRRVDVKSGNRGSEGIRQRFVIASEGLPAPLAGIVDRRR